MTDILALILSPIGPSLVLFIGAISELIIGRWLRRPGWLTGLALFFVGIAAWLLLLLRFQPTVPIFSRPWQPLLQSGANLLWVGDGWNWYISGLILLLGGLGIMLELNTDRLHATRGAWRALRIHDNLAVHLSVLGAGLLFVGSGNLLTAILTWVALDMLVLVRTAARPETLETVRRTGLLSESQARGLSLVGALLLLIALLPAGPTGPGQPLLGGQLPTETILLMLVASAIRAGIYPFHIWLLPRDHQQVDIAERLLDHMVPVLSGLWLLGWTVDLGGELVLLRPEVLAALVLSLLGSAFAAWTAKDQPIHTTFVLTTSAGLAALAGALAFSQGPSALIWPTTAFALGGGLWLVGERVWEGWGWQIPVSVGALALAGVPFTPGFLTQPSLTRLLLSGSVFVLLFVVMVVAQSLQIAAMLRSWGSEQHSHNSSMSTGAMARLLIACVALGLPLAVAGFLPGTVAALASLPDAIPPLLGTPPSVVAELPVWITLTIPLILGIGLVWLRPQLWRVLGDLPQRLGRVAQLDWLFNLVWWGITMASNLLGAALRVVEGAGYVGWLVVFAFAAYLLTR